MKNILSSVGTVVHKQELNVARVVNDESLVTRGHHMSRLLVVTVSDLDNHQPSVSDKITVFVYDAVDR